MVYMLHTTLASLFLTLNLHLPSRRMIKFEDLLKFVITSYINFELLN